MGLYWWGKTNSTHSYDVAIVGGGAAGLSAAVLGRDGTPRRSSTGLDATSCPTCHGYEVRDQRIGVLATSAVAIHQARMFRLLSPRVTLLGHAPPPPAEEATELTGQGVAVVTGTVSTVLSDNDHLIGVARADGEHIELDVLVVAPILPAGLATAAAIIGELATYRPLADGPPSRIREARNPSAGLPCGHGFHHITDPRGNRSGPGPCLL